MAESTPTIYDVAERAGVSIATVSRALNSLESLRPATRDKVLRAMEELDFVPNTIARGLSIGKHGILGLVFTRVAGEYDGLAVEEASLLYTDIVIRGAETRAADKGYSLLLSSFDETHPSGMSALLSLTGTVDGLIVLDRVLSEEDVAYLARRIPVVLLAGRGDSSAAITVRVDNEQAMDSLAEHLVAVHRVTRVGFVTGDMQSPDAQARAQGFRRSMAARGVTLNDADVLEADWTSASSESVMRARLDLDQELPEVFACSNDQMAVGVIFALQERGVRVPEDVLVTGFDDITLTRYFNPTLTTIRQSGRLLGAVAVDALVSTIDGDAGVDRTIVLATQLVVRSSCGCTSENDEPARDFAAGAPKRVEA